MIQGVKVKSEESQGNRIWEPVGLTPHGSIFALLLQKQASCLLLKGRLRSLSPPSMAAFLRYRVAKMLTQCAMKARKEGKSRK